jgi:hypothetical protein
MASQRAIDMALDLARIPAFAHSMSTSALPANVLEVIRIAAWSPEACRAASLKTGMPERELVDAARFYLQQVLFGEGADCYRILGVQPGEPRDTAREHMRWLLQWLHPDRNESWDHVYAKRVVDAWREVSNRSAGNARSTLNERNGDAGGTKIRHASASRRLPWIIRPYGNGTGRKASKLFSARTVKVAAGLLAILLLMGLVAPGSTLRVISGFIADPLSIW